MSEDQIEPDQSLDELARQVIGAAIEVHRLLGPGYMESVYENALAVELEKRGISFRRQITFNITYKDQTVGEGRLDFFVEDRLVVELKAVQELAPIHKAQVISYLKANRIQLGLLINFQVTVLRDGIKRVIYTDPKTPDLHA